MPRALANAAGLLAAGIAVLFVAVECEAGSGGPHVSELTRVAMATCTIVFAGAYFTYRIVDGLLADDRAVRPADEARMARAVATLVATEMRAELAQAVESVYRGGMVVGAERASRTNSNGHGIPKLAHLPER